LPFDGVIIGLMAGDEKRIDLSISFKIFGLLFTQFYARLRVADETALMLTLPETALDFSGFMPFLLIFGGFVQTRLNFSCCTKRVGLVCYAHPARRT